MMLLTVRLPAEDRTRTCLRSGARAALALFGALALLGWAAAACAADGPALFRDADLRLGEKLITEHRCAACHARRVGGDGSAIYRPAGRISSPAALQAMVEMCNTELKLQLFPEEVLAMAAVLQRDHYRFGAAPGR
ncbi:MAG: hypothetical protein ACOYLV_05280 [Rubrivivax sp.]